MTDKLLTEREWKSFSKAAAYKGEALAKAFSAFDKADKAAAQIQLEALDELEKQSDLLLKANKADKALAGYLADVGKAAKKARNDAEQAKEDEAKKKAVEEEEDEPNDVLLDPKKLLGQLNLCKRDPERTVRFGFVDGKDKQPAALALSPKMTARKIFARLQTATGVKTGAFGSAWIDGTVLMLQLDKPMGGLVKKIRGPVKACGFRITKAVLWNEDGTVFEQDEEPGDAPAMPESPPLPPAQAAAPGEPAALNPSAEAFKARLTALVGRLQDAAPATAAAVKLKGSEAGVMARKQDFTAANALLDDAEKLLQAPARPTVGTADAADAAFKVRLTALLPGIQAAKAAGHPALGDITNKIGEAGMLARKKDFAPAHALIDEVDTLLAPTKPTALPASLRVAVQAWRDANELVDGQIAALQGALRATGDKEMAEIAEFGMNGLTGNFKVRLMAALPGLRSAEGPALQAAAAKTLPLVMGIHRHLQQEPRVEACENNPFGVMVTIEATLGGALQDLAEALKKVAEPVA